MIRLAIRVPEESAELVLAELADLSPGGIEECEAGEGFVEYAIYGAEGEIPALPELEAAVGEVPVEVTTSVVEDGWESRWKDFHRAATVEAAGRRIRVSPPWDAGGGEAEVVIDPGRAFGTGAHPTTRLCLGLLLQEPVAGSCVDLGCGSGVLAIAAASLGWRPVRAVDHDPASVEASVANARVNGVSLEVGRFDLLRGGPAPSADLVLANLLRPLLLEVAREGFAGPAPRVVIASGLLVREADEVSAALARGLGMQETARSAEGDWAALRLTVS